jgi:hypothetical protein
LFVRQTLAVLPQLSLLEAEDGINCLAVAYRKQPDLINGLSITAAVKALKKQGDDDSERVWREIGVVVASVTKQE